MADFSSGVKRYIKAACVVEVGFPVDWNDRPDISCKHCKFYIRSAQRCGLNQEIVNFPERYIGHFCPLEFEESNEVIEDV